MTPAELTARAFEIADESMAAQLQCHSLCADDHGVTWAIVDDEGAGVHDLSEADEGVQEAVEWLQLRELAEVVESPDGLVVVLEEDLS